MKRDNWEGGHRVPMIARWPGKIPQCSGGNNYDRGRLKNRFDISESEPGAPGQLYDLKRDPGEKNNLYHAYPEVVKELKTKLEEFRTSGRSAPLR